MGFSQVHCSNLKLAFLFRFLDGLDRLVELISQNGTLKVEPAFLGMAIASVFHGLEEYVYPGGFLRWLRFVFPRTAPGPVGAVIINGAFFALVLSTLSNPKSTPVFSLSVAGLLLANGALHIAGTLLTKRYSPGAITSLLCYFPAAAFALMTIPVKWHMDGFHVTLAILLGLLWQLIPLGFMLRR